MKELDNTFKKILFVISPTKSNKKSNIRNKYKILLKTLEKDFKKI